MSPILARSAVFLLVLPVLLLPRSVAAQDAPVAAAASPSRVETSPFVDNDFPTLLRDLKIQPTDLLEASLFVEDRGAKLTYAPFLYGLVNYRPVLSEARFTISQANGITTMGAGAAYDPASPRSKRGARLWEAGAPKTTPPLGYILFLRSQAQLLSGDIDKLVQEFEKASDARRLAISREVADLRARATALSTEADRVIGVETRQEASRISTFYEQLLETSIPVVSASFTTSFFSILGGTRVDSNNNGRADTALKVRGRALALAADLPFRRHVEKKSADGTTEKHWRWLQFSGVLTTEWQRSSQEEGTEFGRIFGFGVTGGGIVKVLNKNYESTADYRDSFFIPSISLGASFERRNCTSSDKSLCPDTVDHQSAYTPFVDVRISKAAQFRLGVPLKFTQKVSGQNVKDLGTVAVYSLQLGAPR